MKSIREKIRLPKDVIYDLCFWILLLLGEIFYFKQIIFDKAIPGDGPDGLLLNMMLEHWYDVFAGKLSFNTLRVFYPQTDTLGLSDTLLGPGLIYAVLRFCGANLYVSIRYTVVILHFLGVVFVFMTIRELGCSRRTALFGVFLSFWSCSFSQLTYHLQFFSLSYAAMACYLGVRIWKKRAEAASSRMPYYVLFTASVGGAYLSSFYVAYTLTLYCIILLFMLGAISIYKRRLPEMLRLGKKHLGEGVFLGILQLIWLIPLFMIYLPMYRQLGVYSPGFTLALSPGIPDFFRTLSYAPLETWVRERLPFKVDAAYTEFAVNALYERSCGWPLVASLLTGVFLIEQICRWLRKKEVHRIRLCAVVTMLFLFLISCRYGEFCPWVHIVRYVVPGAGAIRATGRFLGILVLPLAICISGWLSEKEENNKNRLLWLPVEGILFVSILFSAQCKRYADADRNDLQKIVNDCAQPPEDCEVMFLYSLNPEAGYGPKIQMITWYIADRYDLQTINGYTGNYPYGWGLSVSGRDAYENEIRSWLELKEITDTSHIYGYIAEENRWVSYEEVILH